MDEIWINSLSDSEPYSLYGAIQNVEIAVQIYQKQDEIHKV